MDKLDRPEPSLNDLIELARHRILTPAEVHEQRVSFVYGQLPANSKTTKEEVRAALRDREPAFRSMFKDIEAFHKKFGLEVQGGPDGLKDDLQKFRTRFLDEELEEYKEAVSRWRIAQMRGEKSDMKEALAKAFDALVDLAYVTLGTAYLHGFNFEEGWRRVHEANMKKVRARPDGVDSKRASGFDVVKPAGWTPPNYDDLV